jgi:GNAT superfamily N-acetyltransferase
MRIEPLSWTNVRRAAALAGHVFQAELLSPRLDVWASLLLPDIAFRRLGYRNLQYWVAVTDENDGDVLGTTGLYSTRKDRYEARWLGWFCVAPQQRGQGIGGQLLDYAITEACREGAKILRVETSDDANEAAAQRLYESRGLAVTNVQPTGRRYRKVYRELLLSPAPDASRAIDREFGPCSRGL